MAQLFHPSTNAFSRATIFGGVFILAGLGWAIDTWVRSSYVTQVDVVRDQPVPFSHDHHVSGLGIDCRYCHATVENSSFADLPPAQTCMSCHSQLWENASVLEPLRASFREDKPLKWTRVNDLPDYVYFDHSIHVAKGVGCEVCHGRVDKMPLMTKAHSLYMKWCLDCHRDPGPNLRPREEVFNMGWTADTGLARGGPRGDEGLALGRELMRRYHVRTDGLTDCTVCHR